MKQGSSNRPGFCAQHYHLIKLDWISPGTGRLSATDFSKVDAQFFVVDRHSGQIIVTRHDRLRDGVISQKRLVGLDPVQLAAITYTITACVGRRVVSEDFIHKFAKTIWLRAWMIECPKYPLWTWRPLNDLLGCDRCFGAVNGAQFVA